MAGNNGGATPSALCAPGLLPCSPPDPMSPVSFTPPFTCFATDCPSGCSYELHHGVKISDSALVEAAVLSDRYIADRFLPGGWGPAVLDG